MEGDLILQSNGLVVRVWSCHLDINSLSNDTQMSLITKFECNCFDHHLSQKIVTINLLHLSQCQPSLIGNSLKLKSVSLAITIFFSHF